MKTSHFLLAVSSFWVGAFLFGCGDQLPENSPSPNGESHVQGSPQDRINAIQANPNLSEDKKQLYIKTIKERNHLP